MKCKKKFSHKNIFLLTNDPLAQLVEHLTFNQGVGRSSRPWVTKFLNLTADHAVFFVQFLLNNLKDRNIP